MNADLWHSHGADRCGPPCYALESEDTCSALDVRRTCSALDVELAPLNCYAQWPFWLRRSAARFYAVNLRSELQRLEQRLGQYQRILAGRNGAPARIAWPIYRSEDDPQLHGHGGGEQRLAPAEYGLLSGWLWMIPTCRDPSVATCDLPPRAAVWFESWPDPRQIYEGDDGSTMLHFPVSPGRAVAVSRRLRGGT